MNIKKHPLYDIYVSDSGVVYNKDMKIKSLSHNGSGYLVTSVGGRGLPIKRVHILVLETFVGFRSEGQETRHLNGNREDNRLENLAWGSRKDQLQDQKTHGTFVNPPKKLGKDNHFYRGVSDSDCMENAVKEYVAGHGSSRSISTKYGVSKSQLLRVCKNKKKGGLGHAR